mmetsp:Transcript_109688/g.310296  ORF Transcript_109688/g.310296 Transcript_109688/m.310296 type:complete len:286 (+) Transcript_109688:995-1852(+)
MLGTMPTPALVRAAAKRTREFGVPGSAGPFHRAAPTATAQDALAPRWKGACPLLLRRSRICLADTGDAVADQRIFLDWRRVQYCARVRCDEAGRCRRRRRGIRDGVLARDFLDQLAVPPRSLRRWRRLHRALGTHLALALLAAEDHLPGPLHQVALVAEGTAPPNDIAKQRVSFGAGASGLVQRAGHCQPRCHRRRPSIRHEPGWRLQLDLFLGGGRGGPRSNGGRNFRRRRFLDQGPRRARTGRAVCHRRAPCGVRERGSDASQVGLLGSSQSKEVLLGIIQVI